MCCVKDNHGNGVEQNSILICNKIVTESNTVHTINPESTELVNARPT